MGKKMLIDATHAEETRVVVVDGNKVEEFDFETINKRQLAGNIYLAKVTRVEPSLQAAFVDYGGNRHGFLAFAEIHPDYYQIPVADREALLEEERQLAEAAEAEEDRPREDRPRPARRHRARRGSRAETAGVDDAVVKSEDIPGMNLVDPEAEPEAEPAGGSLSGRDRADGATEAPVAEDAPVAAVAGGEVVMADGDDDVAEDAGDKEAGDDSAGDADSTEEGDTDTRVEQGIESVAEEDVHEEIRPARKVRARRYRIQEVIKVRQIMLVQVVKEERGNKGAALTTYLSLAGRYCVLMPNTARGGGISRKITNVADRKKLKEIAGGLDVPRGAGLIVRTAGAQRTKTEIKRDYEYLMRLWEQIRALTMKSIAPAPIYEEGDLIKRSIRDLYNRDIDEVLVEGERGYRMAKDFMKMIMPSHARNVKHYTEALPLYARFQVESYLTGMFNPAVQLKSGGYIVIGVTEALVAIDVNSGRATKEGSIEDTALRTNLEAAEEVARQLRLRDLAGLIVIDFIDMEERKNNAAVEKRLKDRLKTDRARIQVGRISGFGLLEMSRQRLRPGMIESTTQPCPHCHGTGLIRSDDSLALSVLRAIEEEGTRKRAREVLVRAPVTVANSLMNTKREHVANIEARYGLSVRIEADPGLVSPDFSIEKFKTATRVLPEGISPVVSATASLMAEIDEIDENEEGETGTEEETPDVAQTLEEDQPKKKRRRRRRRKKTTGDQTEQSDQGNIPEDEPSSATADAAGTSPDTVSGPESVDAQAQDAVEESPAHPAEPTEAATSEAASEEVGEEKPRRARRPRKKIESSEGQSEVAASEPASEEVPAEKPKRVRRTRRKVEPVADETVPEAPAEAVPAESVPAPKPLQPDAPVETAEPAVPDAPVEAPEPTPAQMRDIQPDETSVIPSRESLVEMPTEPSGDAPVDIPSATAGTRSVQNEGYAMLDEAPQQDDGKPRRRGWWSRKGG